MSSELHTERRGTTLVLTISDPASRDSLSEQLFAAGIEALGVAESDPEVRAIVLRGDGEHFCRGDLDAGPEVRPDLLRQFDAFAEALRVCPKPVIAAVEGIATGGGFSLALACDLVVAAADARFVLPRDGVSVGPLLHRVPRAKVLEWLWLGEPVPVDLLQAHGFVNGVTGHGEAFERALAMAARLAERTPDAVAGAKELVNQWAPGSPAAQ